jgi:hypothetical protein
MESKIQAGEHYRNLAALRTGTSNDGRALVYIGRGSSAAAALADLNTRLPRGWVAEVYRPSGIDAVITAARH